MRLSSATPISTTLLLISSLRAISALTLSNFQQINGFSAACTNAYNTPLTDCINSDFTGRGCSTRCVGFLDSLTNTLEAECLGQSAYENTLIGLFLAGQGVQTLCSNVGGSSSSSGGNGVQSAVGAASASITSTSTSSSTSSSSIPSYTTSTSTSSTPLAAASSSSTTIVPAAATSSTTTIVPTTVTPEPTSTSVAVVGTTVTPESPSYTSTSTSHTKSSTSTSSTSTSTGGGNGGGTPLVIGSSASHDAAVSVWLLALLAGSAGSIWLL